ncbi:carboxylic ester hydrolase [Favolaschia claudopus]|uniref:Carboxylic ester hydrolase n=1 Tax=Favolaschia claudopus TaxID=2862362 RepID=A0AAW0DSJ3_9AGAR
MTLLYFRISVALVLVAFSTSACAKGDPGVSLLFQNDRNWTNYGNLPSALLFHEAASYDDALATCKANNETLLSHASLKFLTKQFTYLEYLKDATPTTRYWISSGEKGRQPSSVAPLGTTRTNPHEKLQFLCTNSAPHTTKVDTDFSSSPRTTVKSNGVTYTGTRDHLTFRFMGVPYAQPPVGPLRFQYPQPWNGTAVDATFFKPVCLQYGYFGSNEFGLMPWGNSEDCLTLHIFTPYIPSSNKPGKSAPALKPVLFWIHGGGNTQGTGEDATFDGGSLVSRTDSVVVTIDHRLNIFGYLGIDDTIKGNFAIADKVAALQWTHDNIAAFGGDPNRVMIFGQSAGGSSVIELVKTLKAKGLFSAAISQSGGGGPVQNYTAAAAAVVPTLNQYCNSTGVERLACLQALPAETILNITNTVTSWSGVVDGVYVPDDTITQVNQGPGGVNSVAYMAGFMPDEGQSLLGTSIAPNMTDFNPGVIVGQELGNKIEASGLWNISESFTPYNATINVFTDFLLTCGAEEMITAAAAANTFPSLYVYEMHRGYALSYYNPYNLCTFPVGNTEPPYYRCHSGDLYEVFGTYHIFAQPVRNPRDIHYTTLIQDMWAAFARTGNPNPPLAYLKARGYDSTAEVVGRWRWKRYTKERPAVAELEYPGVGTRVGMPDRERCRVFNSR